MGLNDTPTSNRIHIGFFGRRNAGKSSLVNAVTGQDFAVVSDIAGTTTDPVYKSMELLPLGPVVMIDTPGLDDEGMLGELRIQKTKQVLNKTDVAVLVVDANQGLSEFENDLIRLFQKKNINYIIAYNKCDQVEVSSGQKKTDCSIPVNDQKKMGCSISAGYQEDTDHIMFVSAKTGENIQELKEQMSKLIASDTMAKPLVRDLLQLGDLVILVVPIDQAAPKGRLILPQQQVIRDVLEAGAMPLVVRDTELPDAFKRLTIKPKLVITDSQAFSSVMEIVPEDIYLTSFSIVFARYKGQLASAVAATRVLDHGIADGDSILIAEGCTHHRQCDDIGTVKLPTWIRDYTGKNPSFEFTSGTGFPEDLSKYKLILHCGGCMLNEKEMLYRGRHAAKKGIPMTNYGIAIAHMNGILDRSLKVFEEEGAKDV